MLALLWHHKLIITALTLEKMWARQTDRWTFCYDKVSNTVYRVCQ